MFAILGENKSDVATLAQMVRRLRGEQRVRIQGKGFNGGSELLRSGALQLQAYRKMGVRYFVVAHDSDGPDPTKVEAVVRERVISPSGITDGYCVVIPVQELEAWILADIEAVSKLFPNWRPKPIKSPERIVSPKEHLCRLSKDARHRCRYLPTAHNHRMAEHLDLDKVERQCPSFVVLANFVRNAC